MSSTTSKLGGCLSPLYGIEVVKQIYETCGDTTSRTQSRHLRY